MCVLGCVSPQGSSFVCTPLDTSLCWFPHLRSGAVTILEVKHPVKISQVVHGRGWVATDGAAGELISG